MDILFLRIEKKNDARATVKQPCGHLPLILLTEICEIPSQERSTMQRALCSGASIIISLLVALLLDP